MCMVRCLIMAAMCPQSVYKQQRSDINQTQISLTASDRAAPGTLQLRCRRSTSSRLCCINPLSVLDAPALHRGSAACKMPICKMLSYCTRLNAPGTLLCILVQHGDAYAGGLLDICLTLPLLCRTASALTNDES